jgi:hypothetical protein
MNMNRLTTIVAFAAVALLAGLASAASTSQPDPLDSLKRQAVNAKEAQEKQQAERQNPTSPAADPLKDKPVEGGAAPTAGGAPDAKKDAPDDATEENELVKALLRKAGLQDEPVMDRVIKGMTRSREFLREKFDTGEQTQLVQAKIIDDLSEAIKAAAAAQSKGQGSGKPKPGEGSGKPQDAKPSDGKPGPPGGTTPATESQMRQGSAQNGKVNDDNKSTKTEWGSLPARDRSEIVTGHAEEGLPLWEEMISKYYESLNVESNKK